jgi:CBS domain-containing protein
MAPRVPSLIYVIEQFAHVAKESGAMTNRQLAYIVKDQKPLVLARDETVRQACRCMWERRCGSVLVVDRQQRLSGIFTGRDAVRLLAKGKDAGGAHLAKAMTRNPVTIRPRSRAIDALRAMSEGGFRHVPVTENGTIMGVVSRGDLKGMEFEEFRWQYIGPARGSPPGFREVAAIIEGQRPLLVAEDETVQHACRSMWRRKSGSVLVVDSQQRLSGIFTGRDAVRVLATVEDAAASRLAEALMRKPVTITPESSAIDALRAMDDGGFRHLPVITNGKILGVVSRNDFTGIEIDRLEEEEHLREVIW